MSTLQTVLFTYFNARSGKNVTEKQGLVDIKKRKYLPGRHGDRMRERYNISH